MKPPPGRANLPGEPCVCGDTIASIRRHAHGSAGASPYRMWVVRMQRSHRPGRANLPVSHARVETPPRRPPRLRERLGRSLAPPEETRDFEPAPSLPGDKSWRVPSLSQGDRMRSSQSATNSKPRGDRVRARHLRFRTCHFIWPRAPRFDLPFESSGANSWSTVRFHVRFRRSAAFEGCDG